MRTRLAARVVATPIFNGLQQHTVDLAQVRRSLASAWGAEMLLALAARYAEEDAIRRLANNWGTAQLYYVVYHGTQALHVSSGQQRPESHPTTQRIFENLWCERPMQLAPWSFAAANAGYRNLPVGRVIDETAHPWVHCDDDSAWNIAATALRTTRNDAIPGAIRGRREQKRKVLLAQWRATERERVAQGGRPRVEPKFALPRLTADERAQSEANLRPATLMDYLWRLRIKTNYDDATMFTDGPQDEHSSGGVHRDLLSIAESTMLVFELHTRQMIGVAVLRRIMDDWIQRNIPNTGRVGVAARRPLVVA